MKKRIAAVAFGAMVCAAAVLSGCGTPAEEPSGSAPTENVVVSTVSLPGEAEVSAVSTVETTTQTRKQGDVTISYEEVTDETANPKVNQLFTRDTSLFLQKGLTEESGLSGEMQTKIVQSGEILCMVTAGMLTNSQGEKELLAYTTNVNLTGGERISTGIRENAEQAAEAIVTGKATVLETDEGIRIEVEAYLKQLGKKKVAALLKQCDFTEEETLPKCFSYFLNGEEELAVYVPVSEELGHYAIVLIAQSDLEK